MNSKKYDIMTKKKTTSILLSLTGLFSIFLAGCWSSSDNKEQKMVIINVLEPEQFNDCHITGSINISFSDLEHKMKDFNKNSHYVFYCSNYACSAAPFSAKMLADAGFKKTSFYPGGIVEWYQKGYPCSGPAHHEYLKEENEPFDEEHQPGVTILSAEELLAEMKHSNILK